MWTGFTVSVCHSLGAKCKKNEYFCYSGKHCLDVFVDKMNEILSGFTYF